MDYPLVSVVTITRNRGNLLKRCISSVLNQTYKNIEHIVVDGASEDNTDEIVAGFNDPRLRYIKLDSNWPIVDTINHGVSVSKGKYITFLDSDDEYVPEKIQKQVELLESLTPDFGMVYCWMTYFDSEKGGEELYTHKAELRGYVPDDVIGTNIISGTPTLMFRMSFWKNFEGWKPADEIGIGSDWEMCARACQMTKIDFVPESLVKVYVNHGSVRESEVKKYYKDSYKRQIKFHQHFLTYFADNFKRRPDLKVYHYLGIAASQRRLKDYKLFLKYLIKAFCSNPREVMNNLIR